MLRVGIVDDHQIVRTGFRNMLSEEAEISIVFEAGTGEEALNYLRKAPCDIVMLDLSLPDQTGVDVLRIIRQRFEEIKVLVLSGYPEEKYALTMIKNGAMGYLCKDCEQSDLLTAIRTIAQGRRYISPKTAEMLANGLADGHADTPIHEILSERELQVFLHLAKGDGITRISQMLNLSVKTVSTYRTRLLEKLSMSSNAQIAAYAVKNNLIPS